MLLRFTFYVFGWDERSALYVLRFTFCGWMSARLFTFYVLRLG